MAKKQKRQKKEAPEIPVNSFADVAFLLIIFFIIATTMERMTGAMTDMPTGEQNEQAQDKTPTVQLHDQSITFQDQRVTIPELRAELAKLNLHEREGEDKIIAFEATGEVEYQDYFDAMCTISAAGGIIALIKEDKSGS
ncbi:MAG: biopolymer transporter ExbD [Verrucomicrobia bacterium]|nr:biopolymer transporter ExbD [Verrucomicrobiota bacterium]MDA1086148.1 biopolymer transporter ExbD [Verrucomicrobiota bacterium]